MTTALDETARKAVARRFFEAIAPTVEQLYWRWRDEAEYEDIEDYRKPLVLAAALDFPDVKIGTMSKRPFGFTFDLSGCTYRVKCSAKAMEYFLIKRPTH